MTDEASVSVIIATYNYGHFIAETLESVSAQTFPGWECIIADDGSTDETAAIATRFRSRDSRFHYLRLPHAGVSPARNQALAVARGRFIQILDADDLLSPNKLEIHAAFLDQHPDVDIVYSKVTYFRTSDPSRVLHSLYGKLDRSLMPQVTSGKEALRKLEHYNIMPPLAALSRRRVFEQTGGFAENVGGVEDWDLWLRAAIAGFSFNYLHVDGGVARMRTHETSVSRNPTRMLRALINAADAFPRSTAARRWGKPRLPLIYEVATAVEEVEQSRRWHAAWRLAAAAARASVLGSRIRWAVYAMAAVTLPRRTFIRFASWPIPEEALTLLRRIRSLFSRG